MLELLEFRSVKAMFAGQPWKRKAGKQTMLDAAIFFDTNTPNSFRNTPFTTTELFFRTIHLITPSILDYTQDFSVVRPRRMATGGSGVVVCVQMD